MTWVTQLRHHGVVAGFAALTLGPGLWAIAEAPLSGLGSDVVSGSVQRLYETRFEESFPLRDELSHAWAAVKYGGFGEVAEGAVLGKDGTLFTAEEFEPPKPHDEFASALTTARDTIAAAGGELIPVIVPDKARMMSEALPRARSAHYQMRYQTLLQIIERQGLRSVDLRPPLQTAGSYLRTDTHWSPEGARSAAQAIAALLAGELDSDTSFKTTRSGSRDLKGDLLVFAKTGRWAAKVGPQPERIMTYETISAGAGDLGLFGDVATPVALVGTSFSARDALHFVGFLKSSLDADVVSFAQEGRGPFVPMQQFLNGPALSETTPHFVIWEIPERYLDTWSTAQ